MSGANQINAAAIDLNAVARSLDEKGQTLILSNQQRLIEDLFQKKITLVGNFSSVQSYGMDRKNIAAMTDQLTISYIPSVTQMLILVAESLAKRYTQPPSEPSPPITFDTKLMADIAQQEDNLVLAPQSAGTAFKKIQAQLKQPHKPITHRKTRPNVSKSILTYMQAHRLVASYPGQRITLHIYDMNLKVLENNYNLYSRNSNLIPTLVTLHFHHYGEDQIHAHSRPNPYPKWDVKGTGSVNQAHDNFYREYLRSNPEGGVNKFADTSTLRRLHESTMSSPSQPLLPKEGVEGLESVVRPRTTPRIERPSQSWLWECLPCCFGGSA
jgi:hypothetical protein